MTKIYDLAAIIRSQRERRWLRNIQVDDDAGVLTFDMPPVQFLNRDKINAVLRFLQPYVDRGHIEITNYQIIDDDDLPIAFRFELTFKKPQAA